MFGAQQQEWVILGVTQSGEIFDVPDWPDRLCGMLADHAQGRRVNYSDYLTPAHINGYPAVILLSKLAQDDPTTFDLITQFVHDNQLKTRSGRLGEASTPLPVTATERREYIRG